MLKKCNGKLHCLNYFNYITLIGLQFEINLGVYIPPYILVVIMHAVSFDKSLQPLDSLHMQWQLVVYDL